MIKVAIVGRGGDLFPLIPDFVNAAYGDIKYCFQEDSEDFMIRLSGPALQEAITNQFQRILATGPDILHYANYRVPGKDEIYIRHVQAVRPDLPIFLTGAAFYSDKVAKELGIAYLAVPFMPNALESMIRKLGVK